MKQPVGETSCASTNNDFVEFVGEAVITMPLVVSPSITELPTTYQAVINQETIIMILISSFSQKDKTMNNNNTAKVCVL
jgi:hypothetical protein